MVQMIPNSAVITAVVDSIKPYTKQEGYSILLLKVQMALPKGNEKFLYNRKEDEKMKAIVSNADCDSIALQNKKKIKAEVRKVSPQLWKVINFL